MGKRAKGGHQSNPGDRHLGSGEGEGEDGDVVFLSEGAGRTGNSSAVRVEMAAVRSKPKSWPEALRASTTPSVRSVSGSLGARWTADSA